MTIIKQRGVTSSSHQKNLRDYINDDKKVLLRDSQNMESCKSLKRWASFMSRTRDAFGHNQVSRRRRDGKPAKNTILYHQILGFNPDECDVNGGGLTPEDCMRYAKEYVSTYYPDQQVVMALHKEYCKEDKTHRYAVHMVINRSNLKTGNRLNEGRGETAKRTRASRVRTMDEKWHLRQVEREKPNSRTHGKQPSKIERAISERGEKSYKTNLRELCRIAAAKATDVSSFREMLEDWGVLTSFRNGRMYATDNDNSRYSFSVTRLDTAISYGHQESKDAMSSLDTRTQREYLSDIREQYLAYRRDAHAKKGLPMREIPRLKLRRPPKEIAGDPEIERTILAYWRGADELRHKMASDAPSRSRNGGPQGRAGSQEARGRTRGADGRSRTRSQGEDR